MYLYICVYIIYIYIITYIYISYRVFQPLPTPKTENKAHLLTLLALLILGILGPLHGHLFRGQQRLRAQAQQVVSGPWLGRGHR